MSEESRQLNARDFAELAAEDVWLWSELIGVSVVHSERGVGRISCVQQRPNYVPLITLEFEDGPRVWQPESFRNGKTTLSLRQEVLAKAEAVGRERAAAREEALRKAAAEAEQLRLLRAEEREQTELFFRQLEAERVERERFAKLPLTEKHREILNGLGIDYKGVRPATPRHHRVTHCYSCKEPLDNSVDVECITCGWILCTCGACGCGYAGY